MSLWTKLFGAKVSPKNETTESVIETPAQPKDVFDTAEFFRLDKDGHATAGVESGFRYILHGGNRVFVDAAKSRISSPNIAVNKRLPNAATVIHEGTPSALPARKAQSGTAAAQSKPSTPDVQRGREAVATSEKDLVRAAAEMCVRAVALPTINPRDIPLTGEISLHEMWGTDAIFAGSPVNIMGVLLRNLQRYNQTRRGFDTCDILDHDDNVSLHMTFTDSSANAFGRYFIGINVYKISEQEFALCGMSHFDGKGLKRIREVTS